MNFDELVDMASSNARFRDLVYDHYMIPKYRIHEKSIGYESYGFPTLIDDDEISIRKFSSMLRFLRNFGDSIESIKMEHRFDINRHPTIYEYIGKYASSITRMELSFADSRDVDYEEYMKSMQKLFQSLPKLRSLNALVESYDQLACINEELPELESLTLSYPLFVLEHKPGLLFKHVKHFAIDSISYSRFPSRTNYPLNFDQLESLVIRTSDDIPSNLILDNTGLKSLTWWDPTNLPTFMNLLRQTKQTHDIQELEIGISRYMEQYHYLRLTIEFDSIQRITFSVLRFNPEDVDKLLNIITQLRDEWQVIDSWMNRMPVNKLERYYVMVERSVDGEKNRPPHEMTFNRSAPLYPFLYMK